MRLFGTRGLENLPKEKAKIVDHIIVCGAHTMGQGIVEVLKRFNKSFVVVDYNPAVIKKLIDNGVHCMYGDIGHIEVLEKMNFKQARLIISSIPDIDDNKLLIEKCREINQNTDIFVTANTTDEALELYDAGADYVILPKLISSERIGNYLGQMFASKKVVDELKRKEIVYLERKKEEQIIRKLFQIEEVKEVHSVHGNIDILVKTILTRDLLSSDAEVIGRFVQDKVRKIPGIVSSQTLIPSISKIKDTGKNGVPFQGQAKSMAAK